MYGFCDYCHDFKVVSNKTKFCHDCLIRWRQTVDDYFDGDPTYPLVAALEQLIKEGKL